MLRASLIVSTLLAAVSAIPTIHGKGSKFFTSEGNQWFVKGIAYQLVPQDPLVDGAQCARDATVMRTLGTNALRVYHVDDTLNHDACMKTFADAGIYLFIDLDTFDTQIEQIKPQWTETQMNRFQKVMDAFHQYDNVAGFFIGNEVINTLEGSPAAPYVKAATRDMKAYRDSKGYRKIPVGYSAADIAQLRPMLQNYLACGSDLANAIDFFSLNTYSWCGDSSYTTSGYDALTKNITEYNIPIFVSETGCNVVKPRTFTDQAALFGPEMAKYWSGSMIYEWIQEANDYGIIKYGDFVSPSSPGAPPDGWPRSGTPIPVQPDFDNLKKQWSAAMPTGVKEADYTPAHTTIACPARTPGAWEPDPNAALPSSPKDAATSNSGNGKSGSSSSTGGTNSTSAAATSAKTTAAEALVMATASTAAVTTLANNFGAKAMVQVAVLASMFGVAISSVVALN